MTKPFIQTKEESQAYAVEPSKPGEHHLQTDDATLPEAPGGITETPIYGLATVAGKRVLVDLLQFSISGCTPTNGRTNGSALPTTCSGSGTIEAKKDSLLVSQGLYALKEGDEGQCSGWANSSSWPHPLIPISCQICVGKGQSLQDQLNGGPQNNPATPNNSTAAQSNSSTIKPKKRFPIRLQYEDKSPAKGAKWKAVGSNRTELSGTLDDNGECVVEMDDDTCTVSFPEFDLSTDSRPYTSSQEIQIAFNAFIHKDVTKLTDSGAKDEEGQTCWSWEPGAKVLKYVNQSAEALFMGDCRDFNQPGTSRVSHKVQFPISAVGHFTTRTVKIESQVGESHRSARHSSTDQKEQWKQESRRAKNLGSERIENSTIQIKGEAGYPFNPLAPNIDYSLTITATPITQSSFRLAFSGKHNRFPFYELIVNKKLVWKFASPDPGPDVINLNRSTQFTVSVVIHFTESEVKVGNE